MFEEPYLKLTLNDMVCEACFTVCDLEVFQDEWICDNCEEAFTNIEEKICEFIENWGLFY
jgi:predicted amidophosphoribosyltransferase